MNNDKQNTSKNCEGSIVSSSRFLKRNRDLNNLPEENSSAMGIFCNASMKRNRTAGFDNGSQKALGKNSLEGTLVPRSRIESNSTKNYEDSNHRRSFGKRKFDQNVDTATISTESLIRNVIKQLMVEIMNYEVEIGKLYDRIRKMMNENEKIRSRYTLMCRGIVGDIDTLNAFNRPLDAEEFSSDDETCASDGGDVGDRPGSTGDGVRDREKDILVSSERYSILEEELNLLESRVVEGLEKLTRNQLTSKEISPTDLENRGINLEEIPLVKNLRNDLDRSSEELKKVRKFTDIRVSNLKSLLTSERQVSANAQKELEEGKIYVTRASDFCRRVYSSIEQYKLACETQQNVIESLKRQLVGLQEKYQNMHIKPVTSQKEGDHDTILERYHQVLTAYAVLSSISQNEKGDISILRHLYEEERRKCLSLTDVVEQQRRSMNPMKLIGSASQSETLAKLSELYEKRCDESAKEERMHLARMGALHEMYKKLLEQKEKEHQSVIEDLVGEFNKSRNINISSQKQEPSRQSGDTFDIDEAIAHS